MLLSLQILALIITYVVFGLLGYRLSKRFKRPVSVVTWVVLVLLALLAIGIMPGATLIGAGKVGIHINFALQAIGVGIIIGLAAREIRSKDQTKNSFFADVFRPSWHSIAAIDLILILFLLLLFLVGRLQFNDPIDTHIQVVVLDSTMHGSASTISTHNSALLEVLKEYFASGGHLMASREAVQMQARMFYSAILAVLLSLLIREGSLKKKVIVSLVSILICSMYLLDVHLEDLLIRDRCAEAVLSNGMETLLKPTSIDNVWYNLDSKEFAQAVGKTSELPSRWWRKLHLALRPSLPQIIYYLIPGIGIYLFAMAPRRKRTPNFEHL
jgi:hypothetical protein